jgi:hypothetical protein
MSDSVTHHQGDEWLSESVIALMLEAARTSETLVNFYQTTRRYNPEDSHLRTHRRENLKSYFEKSLYEIWGSHESEDADAGLLGSGLAGRYQLKIRDSMFLRNDGIYSKGPSFLALQDEARRERS